MPLAIGLLTPDTRHLTPDTIGMRLTVNYG